jgi:hypothetical protein
VQATIAPKVATNKWAGEDEDDAGSDDWDVSDTEKEKKAAPKKAAAAPTKKKMTLKQKLAEKERLASEAVSCVEVGLGFLLCFVVKRCLRSCLLRSLMPSLPLLLLFLPADSRNPAATTTTSWTSAPSRTGGERPATRSSRPTLPSRPS